MIRSAQRRRLRFLFPSIAAFASLGLGYAPSGASAAPAREVALSEHHRLLLDLRGDGLHVDGRNPRLNTRWTRQGTDDAILAIDADALATLNITLTGKDAALLRGVVPIAGGVRVVRENGKGERVANGWAMLAALDQNGDGVITAHDSIWPMLRLFVDLDADGEMDSHEVWPVRDSPIRVIGPEVAEVAHKDAQGNELLYGQYVQNNDSVGRAADVRLAVADGDAKSAIASR